MGVLRDRRAEREKRILLVLREDRREQRAGEGRDLVPVSRSHQLGAVKEGCRS